MSLVIILCRINHCTWEWYFTGLLCSRQWLTFIPPFFDTVNRMKMMTTCQKMWPLHPKMSCLWILHLKTMSTDWLTRAWIPTKHCLGFQKSLLIFSVGDPRGPAIFLETLEWIKEENWESQARYKCFCFINMGPPTNVKVFSSRHSLFTDYRKNLKWLYFLSVSSEDM